MPLSKLVSFGKKVEYNIASLPSLFPAPDPSLEEMANIREALSQELAQPKNTLLHKTYRKALAMNYRAMLDRLAEYVQREAMDDTNMLELSGFHLSRPRKTVRHLEKVNDLITKLGDFPSSVKMKWKPVRGASSYIIEYTPFNSKEVHRKVVTCSKTTLIVPKAKCDYQIRVAALGNDGLGPWSEPFIAFVA
ncbi:MAG TPA: fibronectin type III domain-containing protein [Flavobacteriales bacterium]